MRLPGLRHASEATGALVLVALAIFVGAILQAGVLRTWFSPPLLLRVVLPADGSGGLSAGSEVEILGTKAGAVRRVLLSADSPMVAEIDLDRTMRGFVRVDSKAFLRKQFGVAGAAFVDISRGTGAPIDWDYAVIQAASDRPPTENIGDLIDEVRTRIFPIVEDTQRAMRAVADIVERMNDPKGDVQTLLADLRGIADKAKAGEGGLGRLLNDDTLVLELEAALAVARSTLSESKTLIGELERTAREATGIARNVNVATRDLPRTIQRVEGTLAAAQTTLEEINKAAPQLPAIARNVEQATANLPGLLVQTQQATLELERLLAQLRGHWLLGGGDAGAGGPTRLPASEVRP